MKRRSILLLVCACAFTLGAQSKILHLDFEDPSPKRDATKHFAVSISGKPEQVDGVSGKAFHFDGKQDGITVQTFRTGRMQFGEQQSFTVEYWFKAERQVGNNWINQSFLGGMTFTGRPKINSPFFFIQTNKRLCTFGSGTRDYCDGQWHHIGFVRDAETKEFRYFLDGKLIGKAEETPEITKVFAVDKVVYVGFGASFNRGYFKGCIDEYIIWDYAKKEFDLKPLNEQQQSQPSVRIDSNLSSAWNILNKNDLDLSPCPKELELGEFSFFFIRRSGA